MSIYHKTGRLLILEALEAQPMGLGDKIKRIRMAKGLSQKEVIVAGSLDRSQLSRIENGHIDPSYTTIKRIADAMGVSMSELFATSEDLREVTSLDKTVMEKVNMIEQLEAKEKETLYSILDAFLGKKKLKEALSTVLEDVD